MKFSLKVVAAGVLVCFLTTQTVWGAPGANIEIARRGELPGYLSLDIPAELATIDEIYEAPTFQDSKFILHIQNAHANYQAQQKIKQLLGHLSRQYKFKTVFVEGASQKLNPDYLRLFPDAERNQKLADVLAQQGEVTGAELFLLEGPKNFEALGIEDAPLYRKNYEALKQVFGAEPEINRFFKGFDQKLDLVGSKTFSSEARELIADWKRFEAGRRDFLPFVQMLAKKAKTILNEDLESLFAQVGWPQITRLLVIQMMEKDLDKKQAMAEQEALVKFLNSKRVSKALVSTIENFQEGNINIGRPKAGGEEVAPREVLERLAAEAGPKGFKFSDFPAFSLYAGYVVLKNELDAKILFQEIEYLFEKMLDSLAKEPAQKTLLGLYRDGELLRKLLKLELNRANWREVREKETVLAIDPMVARLRDCVAGADQRLTTNDKRQTVQKGRQSIVDSRQSASGVMPQDFAKRMNELYQASLNFYNLATQRDETFFQQMKSAMAERKITKAIVITGGFHTEGLTDIFRENETSYGVVTPRLSEKSDEKLYRETMLQTRKTRFDIATLESMILQAANLDMGVSGPRTTQEVLNVYLEQLEKEPATTTAALRETLFHLATKGKALITAMGGDVGYDPVNHTISFFDGTQTWTIVAQPGVNLTIQRGQPAAPAVAPTTTTVENVLNVTAGPISALPKPVVPVASAVVTPTPQKTFASRLALLWTTAMAPTAIFPSFTKVLAPARSDARAGEAEMELTSAKKEQINAMRTADPNSEKYRKALAAAKQWAVQLVGEQRVDQFLMKQKFDGYDGSQINTAKAQLGSLLLFALDEALNMRSEGENLPGDQRLFQLMAAAIPGAFSSPNGLLEAYSSDKDRYMRNESSVLTFFMDVRQMVFRLFPEYQPTTTVRLTLTPDDRYLRNNLQKELAALEASKPIAVFTAEERKSRDLLGQRIKALTENRSGREILRNFLAEAVADDLSKLAGAFPETVSQPAAALREVTGGYRSEARLTRGALDKPVDAFMAEWENTLKSAAYLVRGDKAYLSSSPLRDKPLRDVLSVVEGMDPMAIPLLLGNETKFNGALANLISAMRARVAEGVSEAAVKQEALRSIQKNSHRAAIEKMLSKPLPAVISMTPAALFWRRLMDGLSDAAQTYQFILSAPLNFVPFGLAVSRRMLSHDMYEYQAAPSDKTRSEVREIENSEISMDAAAQALDRVSKTAGNDLRTQNPGKAQISVRTLAVFLFRAIEALKNPVDGTPLLTPEQIAQLRDVEYPIALELAARKGARAVSSMLDTIALGVQTVESIVQNKVGSADAFSDLQKSFAAFSQADLAEIVTAAIARSPELVRTYRPASKLGVELDPAALTVTALREKLAAVAQEVGVDMAQLDAARYPDSFLQANIDAAVKAGERLVASIIQAANGRPELYIATAKVVNKGFLRQKAENALTINAKLNDMVAATPAVRKMVDDGRIIGLVPKNMDSRNLVRTSDLGLPPGIVIAAPWGGTQTADLANGYAYLVIDDFSKPGTVEYYMVQKERSDADPVGYIAAPAMPAQAGLARSENRLREIIAANQRRFDVSARMYGLDPGEMAALERMEEASTRRLADEREAQIRQARAAIESAERAIAERRRSDPGNVAAIATFVEDAEGARWNLSKLENAKALAEGRQPLALPAISDAGVLAAEPSLSKQQTDALLLKIADAADKLKSEEEMLDSPFVQIEGTTQMVREHAAAVDRARENLQRLQIEWAFATGKLPGAVQNLDAKGILGAISGMSAAGDAGAIAGGMIAEATEGMVRLLRERFEKEPARLREGLKKAIAAGASDAELRARGRMVVAVEDQTKELAALERALGRPALRGYSDDWDDLGPGYGVGFGRSEARLGEFVEYARQQTAFFTVESAYYREYNNDFEAVAMAFVLDNMAKKMRPTFDPRNDPQRDLLQLRSKLIRYEPAPERGPIQDYKKIKEEASVKIGKAGMAEVQSMVRDHEAFLAEVKRLSDALKSVRAPSQPAAYTNYMRVTDRLRLVLKLQNIDDGTLPTITPSEFLFTPARMPQEEKTQLLADAREILAQSAVARSEARGSFVRLRPAIGFEIRNPSPQQLSDILAEDILFFRELWKGQPEIAAMLKEAATPAGLLSEKGKSLLRDLSFALDAEGVAQYGLLQLDRQDLESRIQTLDRELLRMQPYKGKPGLFAAVGDFATSLLWRGLIQSVTAEKADLQRQLASKTEEQAQVRTLKDFGGLNLRDLIAREKIRDRLTWDFASARARAAAAAAENLQAGAGNIPATQRLASAVAQLKRNTGSILDEVALAVKNSSDRGRLAEAMGEMFNENLGPEALPNVTDFMNAVTSQDAAAITKARESLTGFVTQQILDGKIPPAARAEVRGLNVAEVSQRLMDLTRQLNAELARPAAQKNTSLIDSLISQRRALAVQYVNEQLGERVVDGRLTGNNEIVAIVERYIMDKERTDIQTLLLEGEHTDKVIRKLKRISEIASRTMTESLAQGGEAQIQASQADLEALTPSLKERSRFYPADEIAKFKDQELYWRDENAWVAQRKTTDPRWQRVLKADGTPDDAAERQNAESLLTYARQNLEPPLAAILQAIVEEANLGDSFRTVSYRTKGVDSALRKLANLRGQKWAQGKDVSLADLVDLLGGRIVVDDLRSLEKIMLALERIIRERQDDPRFRGMRILRKENKFIANEGRPDPYRAVQYTITFPGQDGQQFTFELQLKTFSSMIASDLFHNAVYKPEILSLPGELQQTVRAYNWESDVEETRAYLEVGEVRGKAKLSFEQQVESAIMERDFNAFYDLVLAQIDRAYEDPALAQQVEKWMNDIVDREVEFLMELKQTRPEVFAALIRAAHDKGYWETPAVRGLVERTDSVWLRPDSMDPDGDHKTPDDRSNAQRAFGLLTPAGQRAYLNRYEIFRGGNQKLSVGQLDLQNLGRETLTAFFAAVGKSPASPAIQTLIAQIETLRAMEAGQIGPSDLGRLSGKDLKGTVAAYAKNLKKKTGQTLSAEQVASLERDLVSNPESVPADVRQAVWQEAKNLLSGVLIMNLYHAPYEQLSRRGREIRNPEARTTWNNAIVDNQIKAAAVSVLLTEIGGIDAAGNRRDLGRVVATSSDGRVKYTEREKLIHEFWLRVLNWDKNDARRSMTYPVFIAATETNTDYQSQANIDKTFDQAELGAILTAYLRAIAERVQDPNLSMVRLSRLQRAKAEIMAKYSLSLVEDRALAERLVAVIDQKYNDDSVVLLRGNEAAAELQRQIIRRGATRRASDADSIGTADLPQGTVRIGELLNPLIGNSDLDDADVRAIRDVLVARSDMRLTDVELMDQLSFNRAALEALQQPAATDEERRVEYLYGNRLQQAREAVTRNIQAIEAQLRSDMRLTDVELMDQLSFNRAALEALQQPAATDEERRVEYLYGNRLQQAREAVTRNIQAIEAQLRSETRQVDFGPRINEMIDTLLERGVGVSDAEKVKRFARRIRQAHPDDYVRLDQETPYFTHILSLAETGINTFNVNSPVMAQVYVGHDTLEERPDEYRQVVAELKAEVAAGERTQREAAEIIVGITLLSHIEGIDRLTDGEQDRLYLTRIANPNAFLAERGDDPELARVREDFGPAVDDILADRQFLRELQIGKLSDRLANMRDLVSLYREGVVLVDRGKRVAALTVQRTIRSLLPYVLFNPESQLTPRDRGIFLREFAALLRDYAQKKDGNYLVLSAVAAQGIDDLSAALKQSDISLVDPALLQETRAILASAAAIAGHDLFALAKTGKAITSGGSGTNVYILRDRGVVVKTAETALTARELRQEAEGLRNLPDQVRPFFPVVFQTQSVDDSHFAYLMELIDGRSAGGELWSNAIDARTALTLWMRIWNAFVTLPESYREPAPADQASVVLGKSGPIIRDTVQGDFPEFAPLGANETVTIDGAVFLNSPQAFQLLSKLVALDKTGLLNAPYSALIHGDLHLDNVLVAGNGKTIDGAREKGDPLYDLLKLIRGVDLQFVESRGVLQSPERADAAEFTLALAPGNAQAYQNYAALFEEIDTALAARPDIGNLLGDNWKLRFLFQFSALIPALLTKYENSKKAGDAVAIARNQATIRTLYLMRTIYLNRFIRTYADVLRSRGVTFDASIEQALSKVNPEGYDLNAPISSYVLTGQMLRSARSDVRRLGPATGELGLLTDAQEGVAAAPAPAASVLVDAERVAAEMDNKISFIDRDNRLAYDANYAARQRQAEGMVREMVAQQLGLAVTDRRVASIMRNISVTESGSDVVAVGGQGTRYTYDVRARAEVRDDTAAMLGAQFFGSEELPFVDLERVLKLAQMDDAAPERQVLKQNAPMLDGILALMKDSGAIENLANRITALKGFYPGEKVFSRHFGVFIIKDENDRVWTAASTGPAALADALVSQGYTEYAGEYVPLASTSLQSALRQALNIPEKVNIPEVPQGGRVLTSPNSRNRTMLLGGLVFQEMDFTDTVRPDLDQSEDSNWIRRQYVNIDGSMRELSAAKQKLFYNTNNNWVAIIDAQNKTYWVAAIYPGSNIEAWLRQNGFEKQSIPVHFVQDRVKSLPLSAPAQEGRMAPSNLGIGLKSVPGLVGGHQGTVDGQDFVINVDARGTVQLANHPIVKQLGRKTLDIRGRPVLVEYDSANGILMIVTNEDTDSSITFRGRELSTADRYAKKDIIYYITPAGAMTEFDTGTGQTRNIVSGAPANIDRAARALLAEGQSPAQMRLNAGLLEGGMEGVEFGDSLKKLLAENGIDAAKGDKTTAVAAQKFFMEVANAMEALSRSEARMDLAGVTQQLTVLARDEFLDAGVVTARAGWFLQRLDRASLEQVQGAYAAATNNNQSGNYRIVRKAIQDAIRDAAEAENMTNEAPQPVAVSPQILSTFGRTLRGVTMNNLDEDMIAKLSTLFSEAQGVGLSDKIMGRLATGDRSKQVVALQMIGQPQLQGAWQGLYAAAAAKGLANPDGTIKRAELRGGYVRSLREWVAALQDPEQGDIIARTFRVDVATMQRVGEEIRKFLTVNQGMADTPIRVNSPESRAFADIFAKVTATMPAAPVEVSAQPLAVPVSVNRDFASLEPAEGFKLLNELLSRAGKNSVTIGRSDYEGMAGDFNDWAQVPIARQADGQIVLDRGSNAEDILESLRDGRYRIVIDNRAGTGVGFLMIVTDGAAQLAKEAAAKAVGVESFSSYPVLTAAQVLAPVVRSDARPEAAGDLIAKSAVEQSQALAEKVWAMLSPTEQEKVRSTQFVVDAQSLAGVLGQIIVPADLTNVTAEQVADMLRTLVILKAGELNWAKFLELAKSIMANPVVAVSDKVGGAVFVRANVPTKPELDSLALLLGMNPRSEVRYVIVNASVSEAQKDALRGVIDEIKKMRDFRGNLIGERLGIEFASDRTALQSVRKASGEVARDLRNFDPSLVNGDHLTILFSDMPQLAAEEYVGTTLESQQGKEQYASIRHLLALKSAQLNVGVANMDAMALLNKQVGDDVIQRIAAHFGIDEQKLAGLAKLWSEILTHQATSIAA